MEWCPPLHLSVVAIEKGAFGSPLTKVANFTYFIQKPCCNILANLLYSLVFTKHVILESLTAFWGFLLSTNSYFTWAFLLSLQCFFFLYFFNYLCDSQYVLVFFFLVIYKHYNTLMSLAPNSSFSTLYNWLSTLPTLMIFQQTVHVIKFLHKPFKSF